MHTLAASDKPNSSQPINRSTRPYRRQHTRAGAWQTLKLVSIVPLLCACSELAYYRQSIMGHLEVMRRTEPIESLLAGNSLDEPAQAKLRLIEKVRRFAATELSMTFNTSYTHYVDLGREHVLTNLVVAPEFSTRLHAWCYPVIGCANYRGYFDSAQLAQASARFQADRFDVYSYPVTAYSTLGWFPDPVLNTFLHLSEPALAGLILHELAHQQLYIKGDTVFNESFASALEEAGLARFYADDSAPGLTSHRQQQAVATAIYALAEAARAELEALYQSSLSEEVMRREKAAIFERFGNRYLTVLEAGGAANIDTHPRPAFNNARLGAMANYQGYALAFRNMLASQQQDFAGFVALARRIGDLPTVQRQACLALWAQQGTGLDERCL